MDRHGAGRGVLTEDRSLSSSKGPGQLRVAEAAATERIAAAFPAFAGRPVRALCRSASRASRISSTWARRADPSLDLVVAWHVLDRRDRLALRVALGCGDAEWQRGAAWALQQAMGLGWYYERTNPVMAALGLRTMRRLLADPDLAG